MPRSSTTRAASSKPYDPITPPKKARTPQKEDSPLTPFDEDDLERKPYVKSDPDTPTKPKAKRTQGASPTKAAPRPWTGAELVILFETALTRGAKQVNFEGLIEGRTAFQCFKTWQNTAVPFIKRALMEKGEGKR